MKYLYLEKLISLVKIEVGAFNASLAAKFSEFRS